MSSIIGYNDLLLGESVGILGALQRKFVERIKASTERIGNLIDDLIQVTTLETGLNDLKPEPVDLNLIIDNAMSYTSSQVHEKNISMHLDLPKNVAPIHADREALQQILIHLLQNAGSASPMEGTVRLKVQTQSEDGKEFVLIQVSDTGGGMPAEDLNRVFTRLYRADNVLIQGVGDTGVGLFIAKTLTEAQKGRIWAPDGRLIAFMRWTPASDQYQIWLMDRDGGNPRRLFSGTGWDPTWSPDGKQVLFASDMGGTVQLHRVDLDGRNVVHISDLPAIRGRSDWSPQGLITTYSGEAWKREIYVMEADGSHAQQVSPPGGNSQGQSFSPDGQWIAFTAYFDRFDDIHGCEIYIMRRDGTELRRLTNNEYCDYQPRWGP